MPSNISHHLWSCSKGTIVKLVVHCLVTALYQWHIYINFSMLQAVTCCSQSMCQASKCFWWKTIAVKYVQSNCLNLKWVNISRNCNGFGMFTVIALRWLIICLLLFKLKTITFITAFSELPWDTLHFMMFNLRFGMASMKFLCPMAKLGEHL